MKVLHLIGGGDVGGAKSHVISLVKELSKYIEVKIISFRPGVFADESRAAGINIEVVKTGNIISDAKRVVEIIKEEGYQIIHSHGAKANLVSVIAKKFTNLPTVTTVHSDYRLDYLQSMLKRLSFGIINTIALRFIDFYTGVSNNFKEMLVKRNFNPNRIFTVYNGIDFEKEIKNYSKKEFLKKYSLNISENDILIGILARLDPVKGLNVYLQAAKIVLQQNPSVKFLIGGDGKERKSLERKAAALGIADSILFLGFVDDPYEFMSCIDINTLTSLSESFPYVILEGARLKKATVSSKVGGLSDLIISGKTGYLFTPGDYNALAAYLNELINDNTKRLMLGKNLFAKAQSEFSLTNMGRTQFNIYKNILERSSNSHNSKYLYDVVISGYYGFRNIGDDAMLSAIINNLRKYKNDIRILVLSKSPTETGKIYGVDSINRFNLFHILDIMKHSKLFINGGGSLIQDNTSTRSLFYYLGMIWMAKKLGMNVMIYANGIGPLNKSTNRKLTKAVVNQVDVVTLREELSLVEVKSLNITKPKVIVTADPALTIEAASSDIIDNIFSMEGIESAGSYIGFSVRNWKEHEKYEDILARTADYLADKYGAKPVFIPMHYPFDIHTIESIVARMKSKAYIIKGSYDGASILGIIKRMEILIGMRLHALIFAASAGIPIVGLPYDQKVEGFLQYINSSYSCAGHVETLDFDKLIEIVDTVWQNRDKLKEHLESITPTLNKKAFEDAKIAIELISEKN